MASSTDQSHPVLSQRVRAIVNPVAVGLGFEALVFVTVKQEDRDTLLGFEAAAVRDAECSPSPVALRRPDYPLRVRTTNLYAYAQREDNTLGTLPGVQRLTSTFVIKNVVINRGYPIEA